jgi:hypothetical protein
MITYKNNTIKTADFKARYNELINNINEMQYTTKTAILALLKDFRSRVISYEPQAEIKIPDFLEVR